MAGQEKTVKKKPYGRESQKNRTRKALIAAAGDEIQRQVIEGSRIDKIGPNRQFLEETAAAIGAGRVMIALDSKGGRIVIKGWRESLDLSAEQVIKELEPYCSAFLCTYVDKEGMMQGTDLDWFGRLRAATGHSITAAGGITTLNEIRALRDMDIDAALGMAIYTGRLDLAELALINSTEI